MRYKVECIRSGALWELHERAIEAKGFRAACLHLDSYVRAILTVFDAEGAFLACKLPLVLHISHTC
jgi:hypothetical protein